MVQIITHPDGTFSLEGLTRVQVKEMTSALYDEAVLLTEYETLDEVREALDTVK